MIVRNILFGSFASLCLAATLQAAVSTTPVVPPTLTATLSNTGVVLAWTVPPKNADGTTPAKISGYNLYRSTTAITKSQTGGGSLAPYIGYSATLKGGVLTYTDANAAAGNYYYAVSAWYCDTGGCGESGVSATVQPTPGTTGVSVSGTAKFSWLAPTQRTDGSALTNLAGYRIYRGATCDTQTSVISISNPGTLTYNDSGVALGTYCYALTAFDINNLESPKSPNMTVTFLAPPAMPSAPGLPIVNCIVVAPQGVTVSCTASP